MDDLYAPNIVRRRTGWQDPAMANREHEAFAQWFTQQHPILGGPSLMAAIPAYALAKRVGLLNADTPGSLEQMDAGYRGMWSGMGRNLGLLRR